MKQWTRREVLKSGVALPAAPAPLVLRRVTRCGAAGHVRRPRGQSLAGTWQGARRRVKAGLFVSLEHLKAAGPLSQKRDRRDGPLTCRLMTRLGRQPVPAWRRGQTF